MQPSREDVIRCYRMFLRREPEDEDVIAHHLKMSPVLWDLITTFYWSPEHFNINRIAHSLSIAKCFGDKYLTTRLHPRHRLTCFLHNYAFLSRILTHVGLIGLFLKSTKVITHALAVHPDR